jgi:hypothetical protein
LPFGDDDDLIDGLKLRYNNSAPVTFTTIGGKSCTKFEGTNSGALIMGNTVNHIKYLFSATENIWSSDVSLNVKSASTSMSVWVYLETFESIKNIVGVYGSQLLEYLSLKEYDSNHYFTFWYYAGINSPGTTAKYREYALNTPLELNTWYHYALTIDVLEDGKWNIKCYLDGVLQDGLNTGTAIVHYFYIDSTSSHDPIIRDVNESPNRNDQYLNVGYRYPTTSSDVNDMYIRKVAFYDKVLTPEEINTIYGS